MMASTRPPYPLSALVGQDELILALVLAAVDRSIGGVLLRGQKGSAKTTAARGLAAVLPGSAPFVELPVGASEDRVVGSIDLQAALRHGEQRLSPGLLFDADGGVLYVDEVNLLPDHLVDVLLDVAASGVNRVEREGVSHEHPSRFVLLGSMNPEEGELRPQFLDRFGLAVVVNAPLDPAQRAEAVARRLHFDEDPAGFSARWAESEAALATRLARARPAPLAAGLVEQVARLCVAVGAEGLRADLVCCRAAAALAGWEGVAEAGEPEVRRIAAAALAHRRRRSPFDAPELADEELQDALDDAFARRRHSPAVDPSGNGVGGNGVSGDGAVDQGASGEGAGDQGATGDGVVDGGAGPPAGASPTGRQEDRPRRAGSPQPQPQPQPQPRRAGAPEVGSTPGGRQAPGDIENSGSRGQLDPGALVPEDRSWAGSVLEDHRPVGVARRAVASAAGHRSPAPAERGRRIGATVPQGPVTEVAVGASVRAAVARGANRVEGDDLRQAVLEQRTGQLVILAVDSSGSMGARQRMDAAVGAALSLLLDAYQRRDRVALITFGGSSATVALAPTGSVEVARARLSDLTSGGRTPLAAGITAALELVGGARRSGHRPVLVLITDGRATAGPPGCDPLEAALRAASEVRRIGVRAVVVDAEDGPVRLGLAGELARAMGGRCVVPAALSGREIAAVVRGEMCTDTAGGPGSDARR